MLIKLYKINKCKSTQSIDTDAFTAVGSFVFGLYVAMTKCLHVNINITNRFTC